jgi:hypothetical protein
MNSLMDEDSYTAKSILSLRTLLGMLFSLF